MYDHLLIFSAMRHDCSTMNKQDCRSKTWSSKGAFLSLWFLGSKQAPGLQEVCLAATFHTTPKTMNTPAVPCHGLLERQVQWENHENSSLRSFSVERFWKTALSSLTQTSRMLLRRVSHCTRAMVVYRIAGSIRREILPRLRMRLILTKHKSRGL